MFSLKDSFWKTKYQIKNLMVDLMVNLVPI